LAVFAFGFSSKTPDLVGPPSELMAKISQTYPLKLIAQRIQGVVSKES